MRRLEIPTIDLSVERSGLSELIVKACEELGFFQVVNHGIPQDIASRVEEEGLDFFAKPASEKQKAGPPSPFGYGCKSIGLNGDKGEVEYVLMEANPVAIYERSKTISDRPTEFRDVVREYTCGLKLQQGQGHSSSVTAALGAQLARDLITLKYREWNKLKKSGSCAVNDYIGAVRNLACDILDLVAEGLRVPDNSIFSKLIKDANNDSCFRINHYFSPSSDLSPPPTRTKTRVGMGEHSDPQILTILRSNNVAGLQICTPDDGLWIPVPPDPSRLCVLVGDAFQALTNGRFKSVRHRALLANSDQPRISTMYFGAPPLNAWIGPLPQTVSVHDPKLYRPFTWAEFKRAVYALRLADHRLDLFKCHKHIA